MLSYNHFMLNTTQVETNRRRIIRQTESNIRALGKLWSQAVSQGEGDREARYSHELGLQQAKLRRFDPSNPLV